MDKKGLCPIKKNKTSLGSWNTEQTGELLDCLKESNGTSVDLQDKTSTIDTDQMAVSSDKHPGKRDRKLVTKRVETSSTAYIGPVSRPKASKSKPNIEETLSEFYKELEKIDPKDSLDCSTDKGEVSIKSYNVHDPPSREEGPFTGHIKSNKPDPSPHPHNEPYQPRRPTFGLDSGGGHAHAHQNHWQPTPPFQSQPYPRFHRSPHCSPPAAFPGPFGLPDFAPQISSQCHIVKTNQHQQDSLQFPPFYKFYSPHGYSDSLDFDCHRYPPRHINIEIGGHGYNGSNFKNDGWFQPYEQQDSDWHQTFVSKHEAHKRKDYYHYQPQNITYDYESSLVLILMRGVPGSGKSTLAKELLSTGPSGLILSTDDYFSQEEGYLYDPSMLGNAHEWNQNRAKEAMYKGCSPVIIDNTNIQAWEMKPYTKLALESGYSIHFQEPHTSWKCDPTELEKRNKHGVSREKIAQMLDRFELPMSLDIVMNSQEPTHKSMRRLSKHHYQRRTANQDSH